MQQRLAVLAVLLCGGILSVGVTAQPASTSSGQAASTGSGQTYPNRPIRVVVASTAGGSPDTIARTIGRVVEAQLGQNLIIDNRSGANGIIGTEIVAKSAPDGYTLLHTAPTVLVNSLVYKIN